MKISDSTRELWQFDTVRGIARLGNCLANLTLPGNAEGFEEAKPIGSNRCHRFPRRRSMKDRYSTWQIVTVDWLISSTKFLIREGWSDNHCDRQLLCFDMLLHARQQEQKTFELVLVRYPHHKFWSLSLESRHIKHDKTALSMTPLVVRPCATSCHFCT